MCQSQPRELNLVDSRVRSTRRNLQSAIKHQPCSEILRALTPATKLLPQKLQCSLFLPASTRSEWRSSTSGIRRDETVVSRCSLATCTIALGHRQSVAVADGGRGIWLTNADATVYAVSRLLQFSPLPDFHRSMGFGAFCWRCASGS
jgi:hypothetical protein